ncbi:MAG TPA: hypothetical protein VFX92_07440 [Candidatus Krumholzibacteria bacterium]|nr:hypothetical protein [Candidatus Krumholzibacteria bacterium]
MTMRTTLWLAAGLAVALLVVGIPYWRVPYSHVSLPDTLMGGELVVVALIAALVRRVGRCRVVPSLLAIGLAVPAAVVIRIVVETATDPTTHNLFPFEIVIASVVGLIASGVGVLAGSATGFYRGASRR